ncbi:MAG TPA: hypothetical protein VIX37_22890 [Candidatus Sulfotelmatobacter sp.]
MERWAANTLRTLGIILTAGFVVVTSLLVILLVICSGASSGASGQFVAFLASGIIFIVLGVIFIAWLSRRLYLSLAHLDPLLQGALSGNVLPQPETPATVPLHLSPLGRKAIDRLVLALGAQIFLSAVALSFNQLHFWSGPRIFAPFPLRNWGLVLFGPFVLYHLPYAVLIYVLLKRPDRRAFTYSLAVPAILIMQALLSLGYFGLFAGHPVAMIVLFVAWAIHIVILNLAYQAIQQVGLHPEPSSIMVAAAVTFVFFSLIHVITPFLYRFAWR